MFVLNDGIVGRELECCFATGEKRDVFVEEGLFGGNVEERISFVETLRKI